jgi:3-oxoacyl-[acyl-carrier protein] reductase
MRRINLEGKVIAILGATSGIGEGIVRAAAELHPKGLIIGARREHLLSKLASDLDADVLSIPTDVNSDKSVQNFFDKSVKRFGKVDAVINSAGIIQEEMPIYSHDPTKISEIIQTNLTQALVVAHYAAQQFRRQGSGVYVVISSQAAKYAFAGEAAYCASKAGLNQAISSIDEDFNLLRNNGKEIYAFSLGPGFINTEEAKKKFPGFLREIEQSPTPREFAEYVLPCVQNPKKSYDQHGPVRIIETKKV